MQVLNKSNPSKGVHLTNMVTKHPMDIRQHRIITNISFFIYEV